MKTTRQNMEYKNTRRQENETNVLESRTNVVNFDNFFNFDNFKIPNFDNFKKNSNMKKKYLKPEQRVVMLQYSGIICVSEVNKTNNNADLDEKITGGNGTGRARQNSGIDWDDDWDE